MIFPERLLISGRFDKAFILTDSIVAEKVLPAILSANPVLRNCPVIRIPAGDSNKSLESVTIVWKALIEGGATRRSILINIGGGMVTDLGGFAAATFKRGIRCINVPTTLLAMVDASSGGKTGINFCGFKNEIGVFATPEEVVFFPEVLRSLSSLEFLSGYAEMLKTGIIADRKLYTSLLTMNPLDGYTPALDALILRCVEIKRSVTEIDPLEHGLRKILNFGHTSGHAFESLALKRGLAVPHGIAVAWGLVTATVLSHLILGYPSQELYQLASFVKNQFPLFPYQCDDYDELIELMHHDKKNRDSDEINFTLLSSTPVFYDSTGHLQTDSATVETPGFAGLMNIRAKIDCAVAETEIRTALDITRDLLQ